MTQVERVLKYLEDGKKLTCLNAFEELGITQVAARIFELKEKGHDIKTNRRKVTNRYNEICSVAEYYMENKYG
jgi:biotin operon repressor